ncbi:MAG: hypothetical protein K2W82_17480 [Candidatus Obscuribacterales bacterium]|nr:hypothetical protein [Candidatus Obscuribacterales bacterium]
MELAQLAALVKAGIKTGKQQQKKIAQSRTQADESAAETLRLQAELVLVQIPTRVLIATLADQAYAEVMEVKAKEHDGSWSRRTSDLDPYEAKALRGKAKLVYDSCQQAGLKPEIHAITTDGESYGPVIVVPAGGEKQNRFRAV